VTQLTKHFSLAELGCRCGCGRADMTPALLSSLEALREAVGRPLSITSGFRCRRHNAEESGAKSSRHLSGEAVDIRAYFPQEKFELVAAAIKLGFKGIGVSETFVHLDVRSGTGVIFLYGKKKAS
jgi:zinc D-Ala-D-Ala carboxypeptidase